MECKYLKIDGKYGESTGINRYIMECKSGFIPEGKGKKMELIDTLWNVN